MKASFFANLCFSSLCFIGASCAPGTEDAAASSSTGTATSLPAGSQVVAGVGGKPIAGVGGNPSAGSAGIGVHSSTGMDPTTRPSMSGAAGGAGMNVVAATAGRASNAVTGSSVAGSAGVSGSASMHASAGSMGISTAGSTGAMSSGGGGPCGSGTPTDGRPTTGPLACIVEQHNATRSAVKGSAPLDPVTWDPELAKYAQEWTDMTCMSPRHRNPPMLNGKPLGENLYASGGVGDTTPGKNAVEGWSGEVACYMYGAFMTTDKCDMKCTSDMHSDGCGHYTQVVWRKSTKIGCGVTTCGSGFNMQTEVICNYAPAGNFRGENPY